MPTVKVVTLDTNNPTALYHHYDGPTAPQSCFISLDLRDGTLTADWDAEWPGDRQHEPRSVWAGQVMRWGTYCLTAAGANALLTEITPAAQHVLEHASIVDTWDDAEVRLDDIAQTASADIADTIEDAVGGAHRRLPIVLEYDASDCFADGDSTEIEGLTAKTTDAELAELAKDVQGDAQGNTTTDVPGDYVVIRGLDEYLENLREQLRNVEREELEDVAVELVDLTERRDELIGALSSYGDASRDIGRRANLSHVRVQQIARAQDPKPTVDRPFIVGTLSEVARGANSVWDLVKCNAGGDPEGEYDHDAVADLFRRLANKELSWHGIALGDDDVFRSSSLGSSTAEATLNVLSQVLIAEDFDLPHWRRVRRGRRNTKEQS